MVVCTLARKRGSPKRSSRMQHDKYSRGVVFVIKSMGIHTEVRDFQLRGFTCLFAFRFVSFRLVSSRSLKYASGGKLSDVEVCSSTGNDAVIPGDRSR